MLRFAPSTVWRPCAAMLCAVVGLGCACSASKPPEDENEPRASYAEVRSLLSQAVDAGVRAIPDVVVPGSFGRELIGPQTPHEGLVLLDVESQRLARLLALGLQQDLLVPAQVVRRYRDRPLYLAFVLLSLGEQESEYSDILEEARSVLETPEYEGQDDDEELSVLAALRVIEWQGEEQDRTLLVPLLGSSDPDVRAGAQWTMQVLERKATMRTRLP